MTSPPYWGLRDYGVEGQIGFEKSPEEYTTKMVEVFRECRRVLKADGTLWLNLGDSYAGGNRNRNGDGSLAVTSEKQLSNTGSLIEPFAVPDGLKPKDLCGIPWRVAFALQADGWYLRSDIIWAKPNPMPESVTDRPTKSHEYVFLMSKSAKYYYDADAIAEPALYVEITGMDATGFKDPKSFNGKHGKRVSGQYADTPSVNGRAACPQLADMIEPNGKRNKRTVWTQPTSQFPEAHFATFPPDLIKPMVLAGSKPGDIVLDPFIGAGTVALVAKELNRKYLGIELNPAYIKMAERRLRQEVLELA